VWNRNFAQIKKVMKIQLTKIVFASLIALGTVSFVSCNSQSDNKKKEASNEKEAPKSQKGNWVESDAKKFLADVDSSMANFKEAIGEEIAKKVAICYLDKAILTFENYEEASKNPEKCNELATECVNELAKPEDSKLKEIAKENISEEKVKEVTGNLDKMLKDQLPK